MKEYHKIQTVFLRDPATNFKTLLDGQYALPEFEYLAKSEWVFTEKVDGTNIRVMWDGAVITFGGKTDNASIPAHLVNRLRDMFTGPIFHSAFLPGPTAVCLYGEGYGAKILGGGKYALGHDFVLFDVNIGGVWLERSNVEDIANKLAIDAVPIIGRGQLLDAVAMTREGFKSQWGDFTAEGLVMRPAVELFDRRGNRIISKIKYKDFSR